MLAGPPFWPPGRVARLTALYWTRYGFLFCPDADANHDLDPDPLSGSRRNGWQALQSGDGRLAYGTCGQEIRDAHHASGKWRMLRQVGG